ncbi:tyrosine-protein phosphatase [bacterium]|nr:tyrosine-protein phosphatase [bacterium]
MKKILLLITILLSVFFISACKNVQNLDNASIEHDLEFGGIYIKSSIDNFNNLGYDFGDSVDISFSNGYTLDDIPYFSGYYVPAGDYLLVGYPGHDYIEVQINCGDDTWIIAELEDSDTASISLNKKKKYLDIQNALNIKYYDERNKYETDIEFANFRNIAVGNIKENTLYRSASPCDNKHKRASYVDSLMSEYNIMYMLNLADTKEKIDEFIAKEDFNSPYFLSLYQENNYSLLTLNMNYKSKDFQNKVCRGLKDIIDNDGPYLIHCLEGKDRTGFVCILLEALLGATYNEIVDDYMTTYYNYYKIDKRSEKYDIIKNMNMDEMLRFITNDENTPLNEIDLVASAKSYLLNGGMSNDEINSLINKLSK